mmetsp:Transcript_6717/g.11105  ORF Transcript_6717/g.11105 Transcript_6717/m.11105 type:complete len:282 (+) Transcript_6717:501-1346(+)
MNRTNGVFSRHGIRHVLGAALGIVHSGEDEVRHNLKVQGNRGRNGEDLGGFSVTLVSLGGGNSKVAVSLGGSVQLENTVGVLSILTLLLNNVGHELGGRLGSRVSAIWERSPVGIQEGTGHSGLQALEVAFGHDWLDNIDGTGLDKSLLGDRPLGKVEDNEKGEILKGVGSPTGRRSSGSTDVLNNALRDLGLSNHSGVILGFGKVLDQTTSPTYTLRLSGSRLWHSRGIGEEFLKNTEKGVWVFERSLGVLSFTDRGVLQDRCNGGLEERKIHEADAAQI